MSTADFKYAQHLQRSNWLAGVDGKTARSAARMWQLGAVEKIAVKKVAGGGEVRITAEVWPPGRKNPLSVLVFLSRQSDGKVLVAPNCSCGKGQLCQHVVAVVQEFISMCKNEVASRRGPAKKRKVPTKRKQSRFTPRLGARYLACQIVPMEASGGVGLEVLHSPRPIVDGIGLVRCSGKKLHCPDLKEALSQRWMRALLTKFQQCVPGDDGAESTEVLQIQVDPAKWTELVDELLKWQILYWGGGTNPALLHPGEPRRATPTWRFDEARERFVTAWDLDEPAAAVVPGLPLRYVDPRRRLIGKIESEMPDALAVQWVDQAGRVPDAKQIAKWNAAAERAGADGRFPAPPPREVIDAQKDEPVACLHLSQREVPRSTMRGVWSPVYEEQPVAALVFRYGEHDVPERGRGFALEDERFRILRNEAAEKKSIELLDQLGLVSFARTLPSEAVSDDLINLRWIGTWETMASQEAWMAFMTEQVPRLEKAGWDIVYGDHFAMRFVRPERWIQELREQRNRSWFEFELGVECDGKRIDLIPVLIAYLEHHDDVERQIEFLDPEDRVPIRLEDGRYLAFPVKRLEPIVRILKDILENRRADSRETDQVHQLVAAEFLQDSSEYTHAGEARAALEGMAHRLSDFAGIAPVTSPQGLQATLRDYQKDGFRWLQFLSKYGLGGVLADDMGLGKTLQTIAHILCEKESGNLKQPVLVVTPTSLVGNWKNELQKFAPDLRVHVHYGPDRHSARQPFDAADVIITSYALIYRDQEFLETRCFSHLILDEAQNIKNPASRSARAVCALDAEHRLCLSGTPMENHLEELWSLFHFLMPGFLGYLESFRRRFRNPIERDQDEGVRDLLASRVGPLMLRRKKTEVAKELPPKTEMIRTVELAGSQRDLYETIRASMQQRVQEVIAEQGIERAHLYILDALLKLRQVCCHPHLLDLEAAQSVPVSAKMDLLFELLPEMIAEGRRVLLFSQFTSMLSLIEKRLLEEEIAYVKLTGNTRNRSTVVDQFQSGEVPLFLISLKAGGVGLNLTRADTVIHYDPWWNPAVESQATDRAYRIGQNNPVFVYKLITQGSIEERIVAMQEEKKELVESLLSAGTKRGLKLGKADLDQLLRPLN